MAKLGKGMLFSVEQAWREEIRAPLKSPAWEASEVIARPVYRASLLLSMIEIELYQISLSLGRGRSAYEITKSHAKINHRYLTKINSRYYGLPLIR